MSSLKEMAEEHFLFQLPLLNLIFWPQTERTNASASKHPALHCSTTSQLICFEDISACVLLWHSILAWRKELAASFYPSLTCMLLGWDREYFFFQALYHINPGNKPFTVQFPSPAHYSYTPFQSPDIFWTFHFGKSYMMAFSSIHKVINNKVILYILHTPCTSN